MFDKATMMKHGICRCQMPNSGLFEGWYLGDSLNGFGRFISTQGKNTFYIGMFKDDKFNGHGKMQYDDLSIYSGNWLDGERHGQGKLVDRKGKVTEGFWLNDKFQK